MEVSWISVWLTGAFKMDWLWDLVAVSWLRITITKSANQTKGWNKPAMKRLRYSRF